jgi:hypothetical protein
MPQIIIVIIEATLLSLRLNPTIPPLGAGRFGIHASALIVIAVRASGELPIGQPTELLWLECASQGINPNPDHTEPLTTPNH